MASSTPRVDAGVLQHYLLPCIHSEMEGRNHSFKATMRALAVLPLYDCLPTSPPSPLPFKAMSPLPLKVPQHLGHFSCCGSIQDTFPGPWSILLISILLWYFLYFTALLPSAPPPLALSAACLPGPPPTHSQPVPSDYNAKPCLFSKTFLHHHSSCTFSPSGSVSK